jgi:membrane-associated HD superfamily phosphohydrolase
MSVQKISSWLLYLLMAISVISAVYFYGVGYDELTPEHVDQFLNWSYILLFLGAATALLLGFVTFVKNILVEPKSAVKSLVGPVAIIAIVIVSYLLADGTPMKIIGYTGPDNIPSMLMFADTILYSMYALAIIAVLLVLVSSVAKLFR